MKNILLITLDFWPNKGGVANYYYNLVKNLPKDNIFVLTSAKKADLNLRIYNQSLLYKFFWPRWLFALKTSIFLVKKHHIKMLWVGDLLPSGTVAYLIYKLFKIPYFVSLHGLDILNAQKYFRKRKLAKKILNNAKFITANSHCTKNLLKDLVKDQNKIKIIYPGVNKDFTKIDEKKLKETKEKYALFDKRVILSVGRLVQRKNQEIVIEAMKDLIKKYPNLRYLIIGNGPEKNRYNFLIKKYHLSEQVKILDNIENDELPYFYEIANLFVMPSKSSARDIEGFGIVYLEAGLFAKVVIAGSQGGAREAVLDKKTGLLVDAQELKSLKNAIIKLLENPDLAQKLGNNARLRIQENFLWPQISQKLIDYIEK